MIQNVPKYFFGANLKQLKIRMKSVESIKKITKAMKMIAATKMSSQQKQLEAGQHFAVGQVQKLLENESYIQKKKPTPTNKLTMLVPVTSDKGLCGAINSSIIRDIKNTIGKDSSSYRIFCLGGKGEVALPRPFPDIFINSISAIGTLNWPIASSIGYQVCQTAGVNGCDNIVIVFNWYKNVVSQYITHTNIMPRDFFMKHFKFLVRHEATEPDLEYAKHHFYELYSGSIFYNALLHNNTSEQASRMNAMENASKNASEMLDRLTLVYNKARQAKITTELIEIISGADAAAN